MSDLLSYIKQFFSAKQQDNQPVLHEVIERSSEEKEAFNTWQNSIRKERLFDALKQSFAGRNDLPDSTGLPIQFIDGNTTNGFILYFDEQFNTAAEFQHFFDLLRDKVKEHDYTAYLSDVKTKVAPTGVELKERHYLKPKPSWNEAANKSDQLYGNVTIEHTKLNDAPQHIKFSASYYTDHKFTDALNLDEMLRQILDIDKKKG